MKKYIKIGVQNYKTLMREIKEDLNNCTIHMIITLDTQYNLDDNSLIYRFNIIPINSSFY